MVNLTLLGGFDIRRSDGGAIDVPGQKDRALLAILGIEPGQTFTRDKLASLLWSDHGEQQARDSLKHALTRLRRYFRAASPTTVITDRQSVRLDPAVVRSDVVTFEELVAKGSRQSLEQATSLYRGDLLEGTRIRDSAFEEWLLFERQRLRRLAEEALTELLTLIVASGDFERIGGPAQKLISIDPLNEQAYRAMMMAHAAHAQVPQALKLYEILCDGLRREFGVMPARETEQLAERIRQGDRIVGSLSAEPSPVNIDGSGVSPVALPLP
ncbi:MAG: BTAD domain-containing putative transcriptional regulator [Alphaproteobacteria bacterium]